VQPDSPFLDEIPVPLCGEPVVPAFSPKVLFDLRVASRAIPQQGVSPMGYSISVIIPAYNASSHLGLCLQALRSSLEVPQEIIVVDDFSTDDTRAVAESFGVRVIQTARRMGPAFARNLAASMAVGDILFFLDADVCVRADTLRRTARHMNADAELDALIGSYDSQPGSPDFISQYRNLMHAYVHQRGAQQASTFWSGCGAIRRRVFLEHSGFSVEYKRPAIEDIELGYRLCRAGHKMILDREIEVTHLKKWTFWGLVKTDILDRGVPWTELILRDRRMPNDLNLQLSQRISVALVFVLVALSAAMAAVGGAFLLVPLLAIVFWFLARWWGEFGSHERPRRAFAILTSMIAFIAIVAYAYGMLGLIPPLVAAPALLWLRHRYSRSGRLRRSHRMVGLVFIFASVSVALLYLPTHRLVYPLFVVLMLLGVMNSQFYIFLAGKRGLAFMLAAIPFHLLYHFYNGLSFLAGASLHYSRSSRLPWNSSRPRHSEQKP
jgi:cellulose synthase/poly-beta-1,6-N-acetylglucosamine synthase-like glycosyltransferase